MGDNNAISQRFAFPSWNVEPVFGSVVDSEPIQFRSGSPYRFRRNFIKNAEQECRLVDLHRQQTVRRGCLVVDATRCR
jgi:hypothetical protein